MTRLCVAVTTRVSRVVESLLQRIAPELTAAARQQLVEAGGEVDATFRGRPLPVKILRPELAPAELQRLKTAEVVLADPSKPTHARHDV